MKDIRRDSAAALEAEDLTQQRSGIPVRPITQVRREAVGTDGAQTALKEYKVSLRRYAPVQKGLAGLPWPGQWTCAKCGEHVGPGREETMRFIASERYFPLIVGIHFILWAIDLSLYDGSFALVEGESPVQRVIGEALSSWVVTVFGFNLLMATRARWVERIFGGLDKMYLIHRRSGLVAAVLLLLHFGIVPRHPDFTVGKPLGFAAMALILAGVAFAAAPLMKAKLPYAKWVKGHRLLGPAYVVGVAHALLVPTLIAHLPLVRTYVFGMALLGCASWVYRALVSPFLRRRLDYTVSDVRRHGRRAVEILMRPRDQRLEHRAGQFAFFTFAQHGPKESNPFTIASAPHEPELRIVVKASGDLTSRLVVDVAVGDSVQVEGPYGHLTQEHLDSDEQVWIAGGIGITPFLSLAHDLAGTGRRARLLWSVRSEGEAFFDAELRALADETEGLEYELWPSSARGRLSVDAAGGVEAFGEKDVVICGPAPLRDGLTAQLSRIGTGSGQVHSEEFAFR